MEKTRWQPSRITLITPSLVSVDGSPKPGAPLGALLQAQASRGPNRPALTIDGITITRAELDALTNRRARQLLALGIQPDDIVVIALANGVQFYECVHALIKIGATVCHVSEKLTAFELEKIITLAKPRLVIGHTATQSTTPCFDPNTEIDATLSAEPIAIGIAQNWKIGTSGGSSGMPKLIVDPNPGRWGPDKEGRRRLPDSTVINPAPLSHAAPFNNMILALAQGCHVVDMGRFDAETFLALVAKYRVNWAYLVPTMMSRISRLPDSVRSSYDISSLKTVLHMAAVCPPWVKQAWIDWLGGESILELYGGTERYGITMIDGNEWLQHRGSVGKPLPGSEMAIIDDSGQHCAVGDIGEVHFRAIRDGQRDNPWRSYGDMGWLDEEGYLYIADRRTDMIVSGGANIYPAEIESALSMMPGIVSAVVIGLPHADLGNSVHAIIEIEADATKTFSEVEVLAFLSTHVASYKRPRSMEFTTSPLRDEAGKVRRSALRAERLSELS